MIHLPATRRPITIARQKKKYTIADALNDEAIILDVRTIGEFDRSKVSGAKHIAYDQLYIFVDQIKDWKAPVIVYSSHGYRSKLAHEFLSKARIQVIDGGSKEELEESL